MPKVTFGGVKAGEKAEFDGDYKGKIPPAGPYTGVLKILELVTNGKNDPMLKGLIVLKAPQGHKNFQYNGYGVWFNQNITDQGAPFVNQLLGMISDGTELGLKKLKKAFWGDGIVTEDPLPKKPGQSAGNVVKIGTWKSNSPDGTTEVSFIGKAGSYEGVAKLDMKRYLTPVVAEDDEDEEEYEEEDAVDADYDADYEDSDSDEEDEDSDDEDAEDDSSEDEDDEDSDEDDEDEDEDDEEDEEIVTPIKRTAKKKTANKPLF